MTNEFSVWIFFADGTHFSEWRWLSAEEAVKTAREISQRPIMQLPDMVDRMIITDGGDFTVCEWKPGVGVTFPDPTRN